MKINNNIEPEWLYKNRKEAAQVFSELKMPLERTEEWRYTNVEKLDISWNQDSLPTEDAIKFKVDGQAICMSMADALQSSNADIAKNLENYYSSDTNDKISALQASKWNDGIFISVPSNSSAKIEVNIQPSISHSIIILEKKAKLDCLEKLDGTGFNCSRLQIFLKDGAQMNYYGLQNAEGHDFSTKVAHLSRDAKLNWFFGNFSNSLISRTSMVTHFDGEGSESENTSIFFGDGKQHIDINVNAIHSAPNTKGNIIAKGVLNGGATSVYRGLIKIEKNGQKTSSYMADHRLMLSESALSNSIPSLQIDANDVACKHAASMGQIDQEKLFYLISRGLDKDKAENLIVRGFFDPLVSKLPEWLKGTFQNALENKWQVV